MLLVALLAVCALVGSTMAQPCVPTRTTSNQMKLPILPTNQFKTVIQAVIVNKNMTVESTEYVDETRNVAALELVQEGVKATILVSYNTSEVFYMIADNVTDETHPSPMSCLVKNLTDDITSLFGFQPGPSKGGIPHIVTTSQILNFINGTEVYKGQTNVSGIPVNHWTSCQYWAQLRANFTVDYYFTLPGWMTPSSLQQIPVRAEVRGKVNDPSGTSHNFYHIYQYVNFENYVDDPQTIFQTPPGVFCDGRKAVKQPPTLGNFFYYREEISNPVSSGSALIQETDIWYDHSLSLVRFDRRSAPDGVSRDFTLSQGPYTTIHDFTLGVQYTIANDLGICSIDPIPMQSTGFDATYSSTEDSLTMRNPNQFFNLQDKGYIYAGQRVARGQTCDVYQNLVTDIPGRQYVIYEIYFLKGAQDLTDQGSPNTAAAVVPMRILEWEKGSLVAQYEIHDFDQNSILATQFDVTPCFPGQASIDFEIFFKIPDTNLMPQLAQAVKQLVILQVTLPNNISPLRLQRTRLHWDQWTVYFQGTLLGAAPSIAKFRQTKAEIMSSGMGKPLQNVLSDTDCAAQCDNMQEWTCLQFDYCTTSQVCTLSKENAITTSPADNSCTHYRRVLGDSFDQQVSLSSAWSALKNQVFRQQLVIVVPLPDASGKVDISIVDTSSLDDTQKVTLTAVYITDQVVSTVNRNPASANVMTTFQVLPNKMGKGFNTVMRGISVDDCASNCVGELTYNCQSFHYCWDSGVCFLSALHPEERPDMLKDSSSCDLYYRDYTSNFEQFPGLTVVSSSNVIYQSVVSASQCAKLCTYYTDFRCESFEFCSDINACYLGRTHYFDSPKANTTTTQSCVHFSRNYVQDFIVKSHKQVQLHDNRIIQDVTAAQCAKLCVQEGSFTCNSFDYCGNFTECRLSDALTMGDGQVTLDATAFCDVYIRQYGAAPSQGSSGTGSNSNNNAQSSGSSSKSQSYTGGAMAGLGIGMICLGLILGIGAIMAYLQFFRKNGKDDMTVSFSKKMEM